MTLPDKKNLLAQAVRRRTEWQSQREFGQAGPAGLRQFRHLCSPHLSRCPKFSFQLLSAVSCATRSASLFCRFFILVLLRCGRSGSRCADPPRGSLLRSAIDSASQSFRNAPSPLASRLGGTFGKESLRAALRGAELMKIAEDIGVS